MSPLCVVLISFAHTQVRPAVVSIQMIIHSQCLWGEDTLTLCVCVSVSVCVCVCVCVCVWCDDCCINTPAVLSSIAITVVKCFEFLSIISLFLSPSLLLPHQILTTHYILDTLEPKWERGIETLVSDFTQVSLTFVVYDWDGPLIGDDLLGTCKMTLEAVSVRVCVSSFIDCIISSLFSSFSFFSFSLSRSLSLLLFSFLSLSLSYRTNLICFTSSWSWRLMAVGYSMVYRWVLLVSLLCSETLSQ